MIKKSFFITIISVIALVNFVLAQGKHKDILDAVQKKYKSVNDLSAGFKQSMNDKPSLNGKIYYSKGNKLRLELKNSTIISDGTVTWNYNKPQKKVVINNTSATDPSSFSIDKFLYDYPSKSTVTFENEDFHNVIVLEPRKGSNLNFKKVRIIVDQDYLITRVSIENIPSGITNLQFSNYKLNQNLSDTTFTFSPPVGANIIDLRK
jgi:chaperone LolA